MVWVVIIAGGRGERFWPKSRVKMPKHLLAIDGRNTMLEKTLNRMKFAAKSENILIITTSEQSNLIKKQLPHLKKKM